MRLPASFSLISVLVQTVELPGLVHLMWVENRGIALRVYLQELGACGTLRDVRGTVGRVKVDVELLGAVYTLVVM